MFSCRYGKNSDMLGELHFEHVVTNLRETANISGPYKECGHTKADQLTSARLSTTRFRLHSPPHQTPCQKMINNYTH